MPLFIGDYLADTIGLTNAEHGAYLLSMMQYWRKGGALTHPELKAACKGDYERIRAFYISCEGKYHHKRIDLELRVASEKYESARAKALKGVAARKAKGQI